LIHHGLNNEDLLPTSNVYYMRYDDSVSEDSDEGNSEHTSRRWGKNTYFNWTSTFVIFIFLNKQCPENKCFSCKSC
jgi:hypothetical protein